MFSKEVLYHFQCDKCKKWWTIGGAPMDEKKIWCCPWCGALGWHKEVSDDI